VALGENPVTRAGPLQGIRILDLSIAATGPLACALLADQGADVIKVERPGMGDIGRWVGVSVNGMSALYAACNRGKRCIAVDIHSDDGQAIVRRLAADADVFVQNFRPGTLDRHGLGYDDLRQGHDDLVYVSLSGFGSVGPYAGKSAYDTVIQAYGGFGANQADPADGNPVFLRQTAADKVTAFTAAQAITAALLARERGHGGQHVELSMLDAVVSFLWADAAGNEVLMDSDGSRPSSFVATFRPFRFVDGWGIATPTSDHDFVGIMRAFGIEGADDPRVATIAERVQHADMTARMMNQVYEVAATLTTDEAMARLNAQRVPCGVVLSPAELVDDEHAQAIGLFVERDHPVVGQLRLPRHPILFGETPAELGAGAPALGEHTDEILAEIGWRDRVEHLRAAGVVA
jgi:crotonobetainyl-CoA:carnitine CoA-transferase CaiB-like acyl-CoA transferase